MASEGTGSENRTEEAHQPRECMPCRGSGKLISNLGGAPSEVVCPWCEGGGVRMAGIDAQGKWRGSAEEEARGPEEGAGTSGPEGAGATDTAA